MSKKKYKRLVHQHKVWTYGDPILRAFTCRQCGEDVKVIEDTDKRTVFCDVSCERKYWKHQYRKRRGRGEMTMSGGMSLNSLIYREKYHLQH